MSRRTAIELAVVVVAVVTFVLVTNRDGGSETPEPGSQAAKAAQGGDERSRGGGSAEDVAANGSSPRSTKVERGASPRIQERVSTNQFSGETVLDIFGLQGSVRIRDEGRTVIVIVSRHTACDAVPADEERIRQYLLDSVPSIRRVMVEVAGTGQSLSSYVRANCEKQKFPGGPGRTIYRQTGEGFGKSKAFTVRGPKWAIDYQAMGGSLFMLVSDGKEILAPGIAQKKRGVGTQKYKGGGRHKIEIRGSGFWKIRVRDGA
jgi:hypothetical protein